MLVPQLYFHVMKKNLDNAATGKKGPLEVPMRHEKWSSTKREAVMNQKFWAQRRNKSVSERKKKKVLVHLNDF